MVLLVKATQMQKHGPPQATKAAQPPINLYLQPIAFFGQPTQAIMPLLCFFLPSKQFLPLSIGTEATWPLRPRCPQLNHALGVEMDFQEVCPRCHAVLQSQKPLP